MTSRTFLICAILALYSSGSLAFTGSGSLSGSGSGICEQFPGCDCVQTNDGSCRVLLPCEGDCPGVDADNKDIPCADGKCYCPAGTEYCGPVDDSTTSGSGSGLGSGYEVVMTTPVEIDIPGDICEHFAGHGCFGSCVHANDGSCVDLAPCNGPCPGVLAKNKDIDCQDGTCFCPAGTEWCGPATETTATETTATETTATETTATETTATETTATETTAEVAVETTPEGPCSNTAPTKNVAAAAEGGVPFGSSSLFGGNTLGAAWCDTPNGGEGAEVGEGIHCWKNINDGQYGNSFSWIPAANGQVHFVGVRFAQAASISEIVVSRDDTGQYTDRSVFSQSVQVTRVPRPSFDTIDADWEEVTVISRTSARKAAFPVVAAGVTGIRLVQNPSSFGALGCTDELEVIGSFGTDCETTAEVETTTAEVVETTTEEIVETTAEEMVATTPAPQEACEDPRPIWGNCHKSHCCEEGLVCYNQHQWYSQCRRPGECPDNGRWSCDVLGPAPQPEATPEPEPEEEEQCNEECAGKCQHDSHGLCMEPIACPWGGSWGCSILNLEEIPCGPGGGACYCTAGTTYCSGGPEGAPVLAKAAAGLEAPTATASEAPTAASAAGSPSQHTAVIASVVGVLLATAVVVVVVVVRRRRSAAAAADSAAATEDAVVMGLKSDWAYAVETAEFNDQGGLLVDRAASSEARPRRRSSFLARAV